MRKILFSLIASTFIYSYQYIQIQNDELYSHHLQRKVKLTLISTPIPANKSRLNLLILTDGQETVRFRVKEITDSLYKTGAIKPLLIVSVHAGDRMQEYGVSGRPDYLGRGSRAQFLDSFIITELIPYAKKKAGVRKFNSVAIAGCSLGGLSAFDIAWNHPEKINKVGVFSGSFWWRDKALEDSSYSDEKNSILYAKLKTSKKRPTLKYWFYAGAAEEKSDRDQDGVIDVIDDTKDVIDLLKDKNISAKRGIIYLESKDGKHDYPYWSAVLPLFLIWGFGK